MLSVPSVKSLCSGVVAQGTKMKLYWIPVMFCGLQIAGIRTPYSFRNLQMRAGTPHAEKEKDGIFS